MDTQEAPHVRRAKARLGSVLCDKWRLDRLLGVGGMAAVYAATHRNGMQVAIKLLHYELSLETEDTDRFLREGHIANVIAHPGVTAVLDDDVTEDGSFFLVMELLEGETLFQRWERRGGPLAPAEVLLAADQLLDVLAAAHDSGIIHRDLKPDNVFVTNEGVVKILDFGIARLREVSAQATISGCTSMGTPAYMPPEQARARWEQVDARTDLWSLGATMFALLADRHVHEAATVNELLLARMTIPAPSLGDVAPGMHPEVVRVVDRALAFEQRDRWADARAMRAAVQAAYAALTGATLPCSSRLPPPLEVASDDRPSLGPRRLSAIVRQPDARPIAGLTTRVARRAVRRPLAAIAAAVAIVVPGLALALWPRAADVAPAPAAIARPAPAMIAHTQPEPPSPAPPPSELPAAPAQLDRAPQATAAAPPAPAHAPSKVTTAPRAGASAPAPARDPRARRK